MDRTTAKALAPAPLKEREVRSIILGIMLAMLLAALEQTIVATALPTIGRDLGDLDLLPWVATAYLLTATAATPLYGKLADIRGRRLALLIAIAVLAAGSVACAVAPTMLLLVAARAVQGLGGGGLIALAQTIIADVVPPKERPRYQVYIAGTFTTSSLLGPVLGGVMAEHLHWSAIFWINLPLGLAAYGRPSTSSSLRPSWRAILACACDPASVCFTPRQHAAATACRVRSSTGSRPPWRRPRTARRRSSSRCSWPATGVRRRGLDSRSRSTGAPCVAIATCR
jgi:MFS family permease